MSKGSNSYDSRDAYIEFMHEEDDIWEGVEDAILDELVDDQTNVTVPSKFTANRTPPPTFFCPCGHGFCAVRTSQTDRNSGRLYYKCKHEGCQFFLWCDSLMEYVHTNSTCCCGKDEKIKELEENNVLLKVQLERYKFVVKKLKLMVGNLNEIFSSLHISDKAGESSE